MPLELVYTLAASTQQLVFTAAGTTSASGALTFTLPAGMFTTITSVQASAIRDSAAPGQAAFAMVRSFSTSSVVVQVFESKMTGVVLGGNVEGLELSTSAITVHLAVFGT